MTNDEKLMQQALEVMETIIDDFGPTPVEKVRALAPCKYVASMLKDRLKQQKQNLSFLEPDYYVYNIDGQYRLADPQPTIRWGKKC